MKNPIIFDSGDSAWREMSQIQGKISVVGFEFPWRIEFFLDIHDGCFDRDQILFDIRAEILDENGDLLSMVDVSLENPFVVRHHGKNICIPVNVLRFQEEDSSHPLVMDAYRAFLAENEEAELAIEEDSGYVEFRFKWGSFTTSGDIPTADFYDLEDRFLEKTPSQEKG